MIISVILILSLYVISIYPGKKNRKKHKKFLKWKYAHRGLHNSEKGIWENTVPAFEAAVENGYGAELDIRLTADGQLAVFHDNELKRMCGEDIKIADLSMEELKKYKIKNTGSRIPALEEVLKIFEGKAPLIIEIKSSGKDMEICRKLDSIIAGYNGEYMVESFNPYVVNWYKKNRPDIMRGQLSSDFLKEKTKENIFLKIIMTNLMLNFINKPDFVAYNHVFANNMSLKIFKKIYKGFTVGWTISSEAEYEKVKNTFDAFIFEEFRP